MCLVHRHCVQDDYPNIGLLRRLAVELRIPGQDWFYSARNLSS